MNDNPDRVGSRKRRTRDIDAKLDQLYRNASPNKCYTLQEIADFIGVSKEAVKYMEQQALKSARKKIMNDFRKEIFE